jgi:hypothetical protein
LSRRVAQPPYTAHRMPSRPPNAPWAMAVSGLCPNAARRGNFFGLLRSPSSRRRPSRARLAGSAAANSPARRVAREFVPNAEPMPRGRRASAPRESPTRCRLGAAAEHALEVRAARPFPKWEQAYGSGGRVTEASGPPLPYVMPKAHMVASIKACLMQRPLQLSAAEFKALRLTAHSEHGSPSDMLATMGRTHTSDRSSVRTYARLVTGSASESSKSSSREARPGAVRFTQ